MLTWKHALCEELRNWSLSLEITWVELKKDRKTVCLLSENNENTGRDPFNQNFWPVWPGKVVYLKRWTKTWTEIFWKFCWMDRAQCACMLQSKKWLFSALIRIYSNAFEVLVQQVENLTLFFQGGFKKTLDYIINQSCD